MTNFDDLSRVALDVFADSIRSGKVSVFQASQLLGIQLRYESGDHLHGARHRRGLSNDSPAFLVEPFQHVADPHREDDDGCRMRLLTRIGNLERRTRHARRHSFESVDPPVPLRKGVR
jgi:hypothetical protein